MRQTTKTTVRSLAHITIAYLSGGALEITQNVTSNHGRFARPGIRDICCLIVMAKIHVNKIEVGRNTCSRIHSNNFIESYVPAKQRT